MRGKEVRSGYQWPSDMRVTYRFDGRRYTPEEWEALKQPQKGRFQWIYDDGGRAQAGRRGKVGDCVCRAITIATGKQYEWVYSVLNERCKPLRKTPKSRKPSPQFGLANPIWEPLLFQEGWHYCELERMEQFNDRHVPQEGISIVFQSGHLTAVKHGVIRDTYDSSYKGTAWIKGFYRRIR